MLKPLSSATVKLKSLQYSSGTYLTFTQRYLVCRPVLLVAIHKGFLNRSLLIHLTIYEYSISSPKTIAIVPFHSSPQSHHCEDSDLLQIVRLVLRFTYRISPHLLRRACALSNRVLRILSRTSREQHPSTCTIYYQVQVL